MKNLIAVLALVLASQAFAQNGYQNGYQGGQQPALQPVQAQPEVQAQAQAAPAQNASGNPIYILNNQRASQDTNQQAHQNSIQEQPVSVVQESPLKTSPADSMRKRRQETESATEDGIVQALEKARIDDEMKRRDRFNNAIVPANDATVVGNNNSVQQTNVVQTQQQQVQQIEPAPVAAPKQKIHIVEEEQEVVAERPARDSDRVDIRQEIRTAIEESNKKPEEKSTTYVSALASFGNYNDVVNVNRSMGWGIAVGTVLPERIVAEGSFMYGDYDLEDVYTGMAAGAATGQGYVPFIVDMRQYNMAAALKYQILPGKFRPVAGAILSYTRRSYSYGDFEFRTSDAIDAGALAGADLQLTTGFAIGVDFRYMTNLGYRQNSQQNQSFVYQRRKNDPEKLDYYTVNLMGKFTF
jgi:hypothetical protein